MNQSTLDPLIQRLSAPAPISVLVTDDDQISLQVLSNYLRKLGYKARTVSTGEAAVKRFEEAQPDIVLLDLMLPGMSGFDVLRTIRAREGPKRVPVVVISALESDDSVIRALELGADDYLTKPVRMAILAAKLRNFAIALESQRVSEEILERTQAITRNLPDALVCIDAQGRILWTNPAVEKLFGHSQAALLGQNVSMLMPEPYRSHHDAYLARYMETGEKRVIGGLRRVLGLHRKGKAFPIELGITEIKGGPDRLFVGSVRDRTEADKLESMKQSFISVINHELRTPLTSVIGSLGLLKSGAAGELPEKAVKLLDMADRNTRRLGRLINDILDLDKLEQDALPSTLQQMRLLPALREAVALNEGHAHTRRIRLILEHPQAWQTPLNDPQAAAPDAMAPNPSVRFDPDRFQQVMSNLLSNAIKFSYPDSEVSIAATLEREGWVRVSVSDTGPGIPKEFRNRVFERFAQHQSVERRTHEGSGLGLSIAKMIVRQMGGEIGFETEEGEGTQFFFILPLADTVMEQPE